MINVTNGNVMIENSKLSDEELENDLQYATEVIGRFHCGLLIISKTSYDTFKDRVIKLHDERCKRFKSTLETLDKPLHDEIYD